MFCEHSLSHSSTTLLAENEEFTNVMHFIDNTSSVKWFCKKSEDDKGEHFRGHKMVCKKVLFNFTIKL